MRLTSIEIKGFKSFGDRVVIHFDKGTTSIVGPNGSGKSNVVDALRWVLGEQKTRMLRSEKMDNIIFNGTNTRKPANLAEVSLTFENTKNILPVEYATVNITRKLHRNGDSEYYLNGTHCRLKDITDLFMDTGIGPDSYSIIELKMVEELLNDRNNTVKLLMEEAAGITKYKLRKRQTMMRLDDTEADLNRVNDLLLEIEKSMKQLEAQARRVDRFNKLKEKYKETGIQVGLRSLTTFRESMERLTQKEQLMKDDKIELHSKAAALEAGLEKMKLESVEKEKALAQAQKALNEKLIAITKLETEHQSNDEKITHTEEKRDSLTEQNTRDQQVESELNDAIEQLNSDKLAEQARHDLAALRLEELKEETDACKQDYESVLREANDLGRKLGLVRQQLNEFETLKAVNETKTAALTDEISRLEKQAEENREKLKIVDANLESLLPGKKEQEDKLGNLRQKLGILDDRIKAERQQGQELNARLADTSRKADACSNEYELTRNMVEQMEGYPDSIKYLKTTHSNYQRIPLLSDIIQFDDRFKPAIENYLDPVLNHFVVDTRQEAWEAMRLLRKEGKGRASFFILDALPAPVSPSPELDGCTSALSVSDYDDKYDRLFNELLGHVHITGQDDIVDFEIPDSGKFILLSENGSYLKQRYVMSGGSVGRFSGQRTGKFRNLEKLEQQAASFASDIGKLQEDIEKNKQLVAELEQERATYDEEAKSFAESLQQSASEVTAAETNRTYLSHSIETLQQSVANLRDQIGMLEKGIDVEKFNTEKIGVLRNEYAEANTVHESKQAECARLQEALNEKTNAFNEQQIALLQLQNKIQNIIRDTGYKHTQIQNIEQTRESNEREIAALESHLAELKTWREEHGEKLQGMIQGKLAAEKALNRQEDEYYEAKGAIDREERNISELRQKREQADVILQEIHDELNDLKLKINSAHERLRIEFNVSPEEMLRQPSGQETGAEASEQEELVDLDELRQTAEQLRLKVEQFGAINPMALESFNEVKDRFDFITKEKADLAEARESLMQTIAEIEQTAKEKYLEAFEQIRMHFIRVFRSLFSEEDDCNLVLTNPENPLESDVHIMAKPKGKRPLSIHQLSGGEKTLTATALLFGIYLLKPSPFCVLDEVDAPLDDSNIEKFNRIIRKFSDQSQFVIITHNKRTMAATDIMYGITMAEMGVTQVVPVDLKEFAEV